MQGLVVEIKIETKAKLGRLKNKEAKGKAINT